jgi:hypothetical protein
MDEAHLVAAIRYVALNPVRARLVARAADWRWSGVQSHIAGRRSGDDPLTVIAAVGRHVPNWRAMLEIGLEAMDEAATIASLIETPKLNAVDPLAWMTNTLARLDRGHSSFELDQLMPRTFMA